MTFQSRWNIQNCDAEKLQFRSFLTGQKVEEKGIGNLSTLDTDIGNYERYPNGCYNWSRLENDRKRMSSRLEAASGMPSWCTTSGALGSETKAEGSSYINGSQKTLKFFPGSAGIPFGFSNSSTGLKLEKGGECEEFLFPSPFTFRHEPESNPRCLYRRPRP